jgi:uncharacterized protein
MIRPGEETQFTIEDDEELRAIFDQARTIAVVGLSSDPNRPSYDVASYLQEMGYRIIPVNPNETEVLGEPSRASLRELARREPSDVSGEPIDVVCIFRRSSEVAPHVDEAIAVGAGVIWMQDGVVDRIAARRAREAGLKVVMNRCMYRDHARLIGRKRV